MDDMGNFINVETNVETEPAIAVESDQRLKEILKKSYNSALFVRPLQMNKSDVYLKKMRSFQRIVSLKKIVSCFILFMCLYYIMKIIVNRKNFEKKIAKIEERNQPNLKTITRIRGGDIYIKRNIKKYWLEKARRSIKPKNFYYQEILLIVLGIMFTFSAVFGSTSTSTVSNIRTIGHSRNVIARSYSKSKNQTEKQLVDFVVKESEKNLKTFENTLETVADIKDIKQKQKIKTIRKKRPSRVRYFHELVDLNNNQPELESNEIKQEINKEIKIRN